MMSNINNLKAKNNLEEDANSSTFRKRRKMVILICTLFLIFLILIIGALVIYAVQEIVSESDHDSIQLNPAIQAYYALACHTESCLETFNRTLTTKSITDPNQIFALALHTAAKEIKETTLIIGANGTELASFKNCSSSLSNGSSRIGDALVKARLNPPVESLSDEQRGDMANRIAAVGVNLRSCPDDLEKVGDISTAVSEVRAKVLQVQVYVRSSEEFLLNYMVFLPKYLSWRDMLAEYWGMIVDNLFIVCVGGLELFFFVFMFKTLCASRRRKF